MRRPLVDKVRLAGQRPQAQCTFHSAAHEMDQLHHAVQSTTMLRVARERRKSEAIPAKKKQSEHAAIQPCIDMSCWSAINRTNCLGVVDR